MNTTANLLFSFAYPKALNKKFMIFSDIESAVLTGEADLGVIIHENRFTYQQKGLHKIVDLGEYWEKQMKVPIALGAIATRRKFEGTIAERISQLIRKSLEHAYQNYPLITDYVKRHSQEMSEEVMRKHIDLYVNNYSLDLGTDGKQAIGILQKLFHKINQEEPAAEQSLFIS
jgi:1,4-dihydroxy-6-naphthoate synthase